MSKVTIKDSAAEKPSIRLCNIPLGTYFTGTIGEEYWKDSFRGLFVRSHFGIVRLDNPGQMWERENDSLVSNYQPVNVTITTEPVTNG